MKRYESKARHRAAVSTLTAAPVVLFAVLALIASIAFVGITARDRADAFIQYDAPGNGVDGKPTVTAKMESQDTYPEDKEVTWSGSVVFDGIEKGHDPLDKTQKMLVTVTADKNAPFKEIPSASDITLLNGGKVTVLGGATKNKATFEVTDYPTGRVEIGFTGKARLADDAPDATLVYGTIAGRFEPSTKISIDRDTNKIWTNGEETAKLNDTLNAQTGTCVAQTESVFILPDGGYLMDLKFADAWGNGNIVFPKDLGADGNNNAWIIEPGGSITEGQPEATATKVSEFGKGKYLRPDTSSPYYANKVPGAGDSQNVSVLDGKNPRWVDSYNWEYDPKFNTGTTWVKPGTKVKVRRQIQYTGCNKGVATNGILNRADSYIVNLEVGKNAVPVEGRDAIAFLTPGNYDVPDVCTDLAFIESTGDFTFGHFDNVGTTDVKAKSYGAVAKTQTDALAITGYNNDLVGTDQWTPAQKLWTFESTKGDNAYKSNLMYIDVTKAERTQETYQASSVGNVNFEGSLGFDKDGVLWGNDNNENPTLYKIDLGKKSDKWVKVAKLDLDSQGDNHKYGGKGRIKDLAFSANGDMYFVFQAKGGILIGGRSSYWKLTSAQLNSSSDTLSPEYLGSATGTSFTGSDLGKYQIYGLAFGPDGKMYAGHGSDSDLYVVDYENPKPGGEKLIELTPVSYGTSDFTPANFGDLASCALPKPEENPEGPKYKVEKRAIDPETGAVVAAGTADNPVSAATHKINLKKAGDTFDVNYAVSVANVGNKAGRPADISDTITVPAGFSIKEVKVASLGQQEPDVYKVEGTGVTTKTFGINAGTLNAKASKTYSVTVTLVIEDLGSFNQKDLECGTEASGGGFFNKVTMQGDNVTYDNAACVPGEIPPTVELRVEKWIVDADGKRIGDTKGEQAFSVGALGTQGQDNVTLQGGIVGAGSAPTTETGFVTVREGTYQLGETPVEGKEHIAAKYRPYSDWSCDGGVFDNKKKTVTLDHETNRRATCYIKNTPIEAYVQKFAYHGDGSEAADGRGNIHVGKPALLSADTDVKGNTIYKGLLEYVVSVKTKNTEPMDTYPISDAFTMPAGLKWQEEVKTDQSGVKTAVEVPATVESLGDINGNAVALLPNSDTETWSKGKTLDFSSKEIMVDIVEPAESPEKRVLNGDGAVLSRSIKNLAVGQDYRFKVTIPIQTIPGKGENSFAAHRAQLETCKPMENSPSKMIANSGWCAVNATIMPGESSSYVTNPIVTAPPVGQNSPQTQEQANIAAQAARDNVAGIPVAIPRPYVVKIAGNPSEKGQHVGNIVPLSAPDYEGELVYEVSVRNRQEQTVNSGPIFDEFHLPAGLKWAEGKKATVKLAPGASDQGTAVGVGNDGAWKELELTEQDLAKEGGYQLTSDIKGLKKGAKFNFVITIPIKAVTGDGAGSFTAESKKLGECEASTEGEKVITNTEAGVINTVLMSDEDTESETDDPSRDNIACIPVKIPKAHVVKLAATPSKGDESHVGEMARLSYDGKAYTGKLEYKVSVRSSNDWADSEGGISSGPVTDTFSVPAGLAWQDGKKAEVTLDVPSTQGDNAATAVKVDGKDWAVGDVLEVTGEELAGGKVIAKDVKNLKSSKPLNFIVTIPVQAVAGSGEGSFSRNADKLDECEAAKTGEDVITDASYGAVNTVSIVDEDKTYSDNHTTDNKACIPVKIYRAHVVKLAANPDPEKGNHVGQVVPLSFNGESYTGELKYRISVRSESKNTDVDSKKGIQSGVIYDKFTVPAGLEWNGDSATVEIDSVSIGEADSASAVNPSGDKWEPQEKIQISKQEFASEKGAIVAKNVKGLKTTRSFDFIVTIPVKAVDGEGDGSFSKNATTLGECVSDGEGEQLITDKSHGATNTVSMTDGEESTTYSKTHEEDNTACIPVKVYKPYVIKRAHNIDTNKGEHVGTAVVLEPKTVAGNDAMTGVLRYDIAVTWDGEEGMDGINTGSITDTFTVPTGLLWHTGKDAKVTVGSQPEGSKAFLPGSKTEKWGTNGNDARTFSEDDLAQGAELSAGITGLKPNTEYVFTIEIPVMANLVEGEEGFAERREILKECAAEEEGDKVIKDTEYGATNKVALTDEDQTYSDNWEKDNVACIPVDMPGNFTVIKTAEKGSGWDTIGDPRETKLDRDKGTATTNAVYRIEVQNESETAQELPQVVDTMNLPKGADITGRTGEDVSELVTIEPIDKEGNPAGDFKEGMKPSVTVTEKDGVNVLSATIAKGSIENQVPGTADKPANSVFFKLTVPLTFTVKDTNWKKIAECESKSGEGFTGGLVNRVTVKKIDGTGESTSEACEPVTGHWRIAKYAPAENDPENQDVDGYDKIGLPTGFKDGAYKTSYLIKVTNDTGKDEVQPDFTEYAGDSFKKESEPNVTMTVTYAGDDYVKTEGDVTAQYKKVNDSESAGPLENVSVFDTYTIGSQDNKVVPNGTSVYYKVVITYTPKLVDGKLPKLSDVVTGECEGTEGETSGTPGVWNKVEMTEDSDGSENNEACVPLKPGRPIIITKTDAAGNPIPRNALEKMEFTIYPDVDGAPDRTKPMVATWINGLAAETSDDSVPGVLISKNLSEEQAYWLFETRAPEVTDSNYELLPQGLKFMFTTPEGASEAELRILNGDDVDATVQDDDNFKPNTFVVKQKVLVAQFNEEMPQITVRDPQAMTMPHSGGLGEWPFALGGMVLIGAALLLTTRKTSGVSVRS